MCDCFHLAFPNWHAASSGTGAGRRLRAPEPGAEDDSACDEPSQFTERERPRPQGSSPVEEFPETEKYTDSDKECEEEHDLHHKSGSGKKAKKSGLGSMFEKRSTPKMSKLKEVPSPESGVIVKTAKDGCAEGLVYGGGGKEGIFIKEVVPESPASKSLKLKEGDQILSATVYFDNMSYEDAMQILEHAQAYKVKLCLKRKPDIIETEPTLESDVIPEDDVYTPEMREQGKTKRRGDARISWPKFPSFGKGKKSRFTRSHSSSEADEQRKLELSPTTSDTESPIKSQDALKGKKKHKVKLSLKTKKGRISSSEDQDTDAQTTAQMVSPECFESPSRETPQVHVTDDHDEKLTEPQYKAELIDLDSTLKTEDLTMALAGQGTPPVVKSPDGKKKKKERSELKIKILGKDKSHKKDAKAKSSPKRLKTLGASIEIADQPENEKLGVILSSESQAKQQGDQLPLDANAQIVSCESSGVLPAKSDTTQIEMKLPKVELEISDVALIQKSPKKGDEKTKKGKDKQNQETKIGPAFKLPKIGFTDIDTEETIPKMTVNGEESTTEIELKTEGTEEKEDPYERLSKSSRFKAKLPKREDIEIPGMEDMSKRTTAKGIKEPKAVFTGHYEDIQAETVQMSIDVDSVKEAVSKLPGFKLPRVDTSGVPIPEEITVIDANAQRISVKTPTKTKHDTHFDVTSSTEISKTTVKLPKVAPADLTSEELLMETRVGFKKPEMKYKTEPKQSDEGVYKREHIIIPGKESTQEGAFLQTQETQESAATLKSMKAKITMPSFGIGKPDIRIPDMEIDLPKQKGDDIKREKTIFIQEVKESKTETRIGGLISDVKIPEIEGFEYIDSGSPAKKDGGIKPSGFGVDFNAASPKADISHPEIRGEVNYVEAEEHTFKLPKFEAAGSVNVPDAHKGITIDGAEIEKGGKFKMPKVRGPKIDLSVSKKDVDFTLPEGKADVELPDIPEVEVTLGKVDVSIPEQKMQVEKPELELKPLQVEGELDGQGGKFKIPRFEIKIPKFKGPEFDLSSSKKDVDVTLTEAKAEVKLPEDPEIDFTRGKVDVSIPGQKMEFEKPEVEIKQKFKMPKFGIKIPEIKGPEFDLSQSKDNADVTLPEVDAQVKLPETPEIDASLGKAQVSIPEAELEVKKPEVRIRPIKMPKFGITMPKVKGPDIHFDLSKKDGEVTLPEAKAEVKVPDAPKVDISLGEEVYLPKGKVEIKKPELEMKLEPSEVELDSQGSKFKMPKLGMSMPKVKGPDIHFGLSKKDGNVTLPEAKADVKVPEVELKEPSAKAEVKAPEITVAGKGTEGSPTKFKMPTFKLPKFGIVTPNVSVETPAIDKDVKIDGADIKIPDKGSEVHIVTPSIDVDGASIETKTEGGKFKMPHLGFSMAKVKGPKIDLSLSKKEVDVTLPEAKTDIQLPGVDIGKVDVSIPEAKAEMKLPEAPSIDASLGKAEVLISEAELEVKKPEVKIQPIKMPKFGIKMPKVKGPEFDFSSSKKDVDVKLPETKTDVKHPEVELGKVDVSIPAAKVEVKQPEMKMQSEVEIDGQGKKYKIPKFGIQIPKVKGPEFDLSLSKKDIDVTLPEANVDAKLPDGPKIDVSLGKADVLVPEAKVEVEKPEVEIKPLQTDIELEGHKGKLKMPKFGITMPKVKGPEIDLSFSKKDVDVTLPEAKAEADLPEAPKIAVDIKPPESEAKIEGQESKFKMPKFGITLPKVKGPEIDLNFSKQDVDVTLPDTKAEVKLPDVEVKKPSGKVEIKGPEIESHSGYVEGSPSKFKLPAFKFPKFGAASPTISAEVPDMNKDIKVEEAGLEIPTGRATIDVAAQNIDIEGPSLDVKMKGTKGEGKESKFKVPKFGISLPKVQGPDIDLSLSKKDVDVKLPETKAEIKLSEGPEFDVNLGKVDVKKPELEIEGLLSEVEFDGQERKFKIPKFGISLPKGPEIDLSLSKKDANITIPGAKAEVSLPDVELKEPSAKVEIKAPEIEAQLSSVKGSPSKFKLPTFKFPKFGAATPTVSTEVPDLEKEIKIDGADMHISVPHTDVDVPEVKAEVHLPEVEVKKPSVGVVIEQQPGVEVDAKLKKPRFSLPKFSFSKPSVKAPEVDARLQDANVAIPEVNVEVKGGEVDMKLPKSEAEVDGQGKIRKFGITMPKVTGPEIDLSFSKKDVDVTLPEAKAKVQLPEFKIKQPSATVEIKAPEIEAQTINVDGSAAELKMPTVTLPQIEAVTPKISAEVPDVDKDIKIDGVTVDVKAPCIETEGLSADVKAKGIELEGIGRKFKIPKFGILMPEVKGPDIDLSLSKKDVDVKLPEAEAKVQLPDVKIKQPSATLEVKAPEIEAKTGNVDGSPAKFKMPSFTFPKFGAATPKVSVEASEMDKDIKIDGAKVDVTAPSIDTEGQSVDLKAKGSELEGSGSKFKMPKFGVSMPKVKGPEIDLSLSKKDVDVTLPEAKAEVQLPNVEIKKPELEIKAPEVKVATKGKEGSPSKFKMPTFKLPKFGGGTPSATVEMPDMDVKIDGADIKIPEEVLTVDIAAPSIDIEGPSIDIKTTGTEHEGKGGKFKLPSLGFSGPQIKGPDMDFSLSKKDVDVTLPEAEVKLPDVGLKEPSAEVDIKAPEIKVATKGKEGSPSKFKMPTFKLPKFGGGTPSATVEIPNTDVKIDGADIKIPEEVLTVDIAAPSVDIEGPSIDIQTTGTEHEGKGGKFKLPSLGFSGPQIKRPDIDFSLSKKDVDVTLPEAEVKLPDVGLKKPSAEVDITAPEIKVATKGKEGSPSKFKMPTFKLPKFGGGTPSATVEIPDTDVKIDGADIKIPEEVLAVDIAAPSVDIEGPSIDIKTTGTEHEGKGGKFKLPSLGFSGPQIKGPDIDFSLSKKDVDVTLPEAEVKLPDVGLKKPSAEVDITAPEIKVATKGKEGSPSKFKMPTFKLPKFGGGTPSATVEIPDTDVKIDGADIKIPEEVLTVDIAAPSVDIEGPSIDIKTTGTEHEGKGGKFKLPSLGFSGPQIKGPDIDFSLSKKDVDVTLPEAEVKLPDVGLKEPSAEVDIKAPEIKVATKGKGGSPSKFKMPTFKLPKFGGGTPSATVEMPDTDVKIDGADIKIPEEVLTVDIAAPSVDIEGPSIDIKTTGTEHEGKGGKFKLPSLGFSGPQIKRPDIDFSLSKKDVDVTLPEAEVKLPDVGLKEPSAEVDIKAPGIDVQTSNVEGSPSKLKMPTFKLPKFGIATPQVSVEIPDVDKDTKVVGADLTLPEAKAEVKLPDLEIKESSGSISVSQPKTSWTFPGFSFSKTSVKAPEADVNIDVPKVDVTLPEAKTDIQLPDINIKESSGISKEEAPAIDIDAKSKKSRFSLPKFSFSRQSSKDVSLPEIDVSLPEGDVKITQPEVELKPPEGDVELEGQESKFKMPKFGISMPKVKGPEIDLSISKKDVDVKLPEAKVEVQLPDVKIKQPSATVEVKAPEIEAQTGNVGGSPVKLKMPTITLPKFGAATPKVSAEVPDIEKDIQIDGAKVEVTAPSTDTDGLSVDLKAKGGELEGSGSKFKIPKFGISRPKVQGPETDLSLSKKDVDVKLPEAKVEVQLPDVKIKQPSATVEVKAPEIKAQTGNVGGSPAKLKMPTITLPKFGAATPKVSAEVPDMDKDIQIDSAKVNVTAPSIDADGLSVDVKAKGGQFDGSGSKFKIPKFGISRPNVGGPEIDLSLSKKDVDVTLPEAKAEVKLPDVEVKEPKGAISVPDASMVEVEAKSKRSTWSFPKFSFSRTSVKAPEADVNTETPKGDVTSPEAKAEIQGHVDVSLPEGEVIVKQPEMKIKAELEAEHEARGSKVKLPKFGIALPKIKAPEEDLNESQKDLGPTLPEVKAEVKLPETEVKEPSACVEIKASESEAKSKDAGGSPIKFNLTTLKMPKFGIATDDVTVEAPDVDKVAEIDGAKLGEDVTVNIKGPSVDIKTDVSKAATTEPDMPKTETDSVGLASPSKFKLPSFKMPKLSFSRPNLEAEQVPVDTDSKDDQLKVEVEPTAEGKSPKQTLTSFGEILKNVDVEFDVPKAEESVETSKKVDETDDPNGKQLEAKKQETKQETIKSPERTGWFKFPKFGLSSPSEPKKYEKDEPKDVKSPAGETADDEISPTYSVQSSDAFADISSAMTSEHAGLSSSSPTKVTVKYSDPVAVTGLGEMHSNIITSTTKTGLISAEPNLPEKITILSSGVSSSSEDTLRLESGKIHVITSNIHATPEAQHAKLLTAVQVQTAGGLPLESEANKGGLWTVEDSQGGKRTVFERHLVRQTSSERSERKETIVITKQITRTSEAISGETASSIQRLRDSVHSEKMKFFDGVDK